jgi:type IX secretion system PorP/SprF family membrane protein
MVSLIFRYMKQLVKIMTGLVLMFAGGSLQAQDLHFSQFFNSPLTTNPANTGFVPDADYRVGVNYRNQWASIPVPFKTFSIFGDVQLMRNRETGWLGVGGVLLRDVAGPGALTTTKAYGSVAYHQMLGYSSLLSAGFNIGWANKRVDPTKFLFPDQWNGKDRFESTIPTNVRFANTSISYFDLQAGLNYAYFPSDNAYINAGVSLHHINRPTESFFNTGGDSSRIPMRSIAFVNGLYKVNDQWILNPNAYFTTQAKASELVVGMNAHYNLSGDGETVLIAGAYYRLKDAIVPMIGFKWKNLQMSFTYDVTTSNLRNYNNLRGASEFSLIHQNAFANSTAKDFKCPTFRTGY